MDDYHQINVGCLTCLLHNIRKWEKPNFLGKYFESLYNLELSCHLLWNEFEKYDIKDGNGQPFSNIWKCEILWQPVLLHLIPMI